MSLLTLAVGLTVSGPAAPTFGFPALKLQLPNIEQRIILSADQVYNKMEYAKSMLWELLWWRIYNKGSLAAAHSHGEWRPRRVLFV